MSTLVKNSSFNFGLIGFGQHAEKVFLPVINESQRAALAIVATSSRDRALQIEGLLDSVTVTNSYDEMFNHDSIDSVYISLPNHLHAQWTVKALNAGLHVLCEKPIALTTKQEEEINAAAEKNQRVVMEAFAYKFHPQHEIVKELILKGVIGEVKSVRASYSYYLEHQDNIRLKADCAGGALNDVGCYLLDLVRGFTTEKLSLTSVKSKFEFGVDVETTIELIDESGISFNLYCGCRSARSNFYQVIGTDGEITVKDAFHLPRNKSGKILVKTKSPPAYLISSLKYNQFLNLFNFFCDSLNDNNRTSFGITSNATLLERVREQINS